MTTPIPAAAVESAFNAWCDVADVDEWRVRNTSEALQAALAAALPHLSGWRPIAEAPRDGQRVLLVSSGGEAWAGYWRDARKAPYVAGWTRFNCADVGWEPTHWQPLPPPPGQEVDGGR